MDISRSLNKLRKVVASFTVATLIASLLVIAPAHAAVPSEFSWAESAAEALGDPEFFTSEALGADVTKCVFSQMLMNALELDAAPESAEGFSDVPEWAMDAVGAMVANGIAEGRDAEAGLFGCADSMSRAEAVVMASNAFNLCSLEGAADGSVDADDFVGVEWAVEAFECSMGLGVVTQARPTDTMRKAEAFKLTYSAMDPVNNVVEEEVESGDLMVSFSSDNPSDGNVVVDAGSNIAQARAHVGSFDFEAGDGDVDVESVTFTRSGFLNDADVSELYLYLDGEFLSDGPSNVDTREFVFSGSNVLFSVDEGEEVQLDLYIDVAGTHNPSTTFGFDIASVSDVVVSEGSVSGSFPLEGSSFETVDSTVNQLTFDIANEDAEELEIGSQDVYLAELNLSGTDVLVHGFAVEMVGTLSSGDLTDFSLEVKDTREEVEADVSVSGKKVTFSNVDIELDGNEDFYIVGDIVDGASRTFTFQVDEVRDIDAEDMELGVLVAPTTNFAGDFSNQGTQTITAGDFTMDLSDDSPLGNVADEATSQVLARYEFTAKGERTKITAIDLEIESANGDSMSIKNVKVLADGSQKGSTVTTMAVDNVDDDDNNNFTFGSSFIVNLGETVVVEIIGNLDDATVTAGEVLNVRGVAAGVDYTLLDSDTESTASLPDGYELVVATGSLTSVLDSESPQSAVVVMGTTTEVGRWELEADDSDIEVREIRFDDATASLVSAVTSATATLYLDGEEVDSVTRSIKDTDAIWFGNDADDENYDSTTNLDWDLEEGEIYELALELTFKGNTTGASAPTSGDTLTLELDAFTYYNGISETAEADDARDVAADTHELRASHLAVAEVTSSYTNQPIGGADDEVMKFSASELSGEERATVTAITFTVSDSGTGTGTDNFEIRRGSTSGTLVAVLDNATPATDTCTVSDGLFTITAHGLTVGQVFDYDADEDGTKELEGVVTNVISANTFVAVNLNTGAQIADDAGADCDAGTAVFAEEATLYVPFLSESLGRISAGDSNTFVVTTDLTGFSGSTDNITLSISDSSDVRWWDNAEVDGTLTLEGADGDLTDADGEDFTSSYIDEFSVQSVWDRD